MGRFGQRLVIEISSDAWDTLNDVARGERRKPSDQAAIMLEGLLTSKTPWPVQGEWKPVRGAPFIQAQQSGYDPANQLNEVDRELGEALSEAADIGEKTVPAQPRDDDPVIDVGTSEVLPYQRGIIVSGAPEA